MWGTPSDGAAQAEEGSFGVGSTVGPYLLVRRIGQGGMGLVFEAVHVELQKRVAVKVLHARVDGSVARERFLREGRAAARVRHPNAVEVFDTGVDGGIAWLAMEFLAGEDLGALTQREAPLAVERLTDIMLPVIAAVGAAHAEGIIHRDLKPENVFLTEVHPGMLQPKVLDFGVARLLDEDTSLTRASVLLGTPLYMSPEQAVNSRSASMLSDQYSLGVVLYECATGRLPFEQEGLFELLEAIVRAPIPPLRSSRPEIPVAFEEVVLRALGRVPAHRFASVHALGAALLPFASPAMRAVWQTVFAVEVPRRTLRSLAPPPLPAAAPDAPTPREAVAVPESLPFEVPSSRPPQTSTLSNSIRTLDIRPAAAAASPDRARWVGAGLIVLSFIGAMLLVPRSPPAVRAVSAPLLRALARPVEVPVAPTVLPAAVVPPPLVVVAAPPVAAAPVRLPRGRRPIVARTTGATIAAPHPSRPQGVLILR